MKTNLQWRSPSTEIYVNHRQKSPPIKWDSSTTHTVVECPTMLQTTATLGEDEVKGKKKKKKTLAIN